MIKGRVDDQVGTWSLLGQEPNVVVANKEIDLEVNADKN
jgi:hypothetical protein